MSTPSLDTTSPNVDNMPRGPSSPRHEVSVPSQEQSLLATISTIRGVIKATQADLAKNHRYSAYSRLEHLNYPAFDGLKQGFKALARDPANASSRERKKRLEHTVSEFRYRQEMAVYLLLEHYSLGGDDFSHIQAQLVRVDEQLAVVARELVDGDTRLLNGGIVGAQPPAASPAQFGGHEDSELAATLAPMTLGGSIPADSAVLVPASVMMDAATGAVLTDPVPSPTMPHMIPGPIPASVLVDPSTGAILTEPVPSTPMSHLVPEPIPASVLIDPSTGAILTEPVPAMPGAGLMPVSIQNPLPVPADVLVDPLTGEIVTGAVPPTALAPAPPAPATVLVNQVTREILTAPTPQTSSFEGVPPMPPALAFPAPPPVAPFNVPATLPRPLMPGTFPSLEPTSRTPRTWDVLIDQSTGEILTNPVPNGLPLDPTEPFPSFVDPYPVGPVQFVGAGPAELPIPTMVPDAFSVMEPVLQPVDPVAASPLTPSANVPTTASSAVIGPPKHEGMSSSLAHNILDNPTAADLLLSDPSTAGLEGVTPDTRPTGNAGPALAAPTMEATAKAGDSEQTPPGFQRDDDGDVACQSCGQSPGKHGN